MKKFNKMLSVLLSLMLCLGMVSPAFAHVVAIDGVEGTQDVDTVQAGVDKISESERKSGTITMTEDETPASTITVGGENVDVKVTIDMDNHSLTGQGEDPVIKVEAGSELTINGGKAEPDEGDEPETPDTPDETDEGGEDEPETPAEEPKGTIKGDVENKGTLTVNKAKVDGNVRNSGKFYLNDSAVTQTVTNDEGATFSHTNSTVGQATGFYGDGGKYTLETVTGGKKLTIYPDSTKKVSGTLECSWFQTNGISSDNVTEVVIADGVTSIEDYAFYKCDNLTEVTIPAGVNTIGKRAFQGCVKLTNVDIPAGVTSIESYAFDSCSGLISVTIPGSVVSIGDIAFYNCPALTSVTIGDGVETIGKRAFDHCSGLTEVTIPGSVTTIEDSAFFACLALTSVTIPAGASIGEWAFGRCESLTSVTVPAGASIGENAFYDGHPYDVIRNSDDGETVTYYLNGADGFNYSQDVNDFYGKPGNPSVTKNADGTVVVSGTEKIKIEAVNGKDPEIKKNDDGSITVTAGCETVTVDKKNGNITRESLNHTEVPDKGKAATCTETGLTEGKHCSVCGTVTTAQKVVDAKGHTYGEWVVTTPAKPGKAGVETRTCSVCGKTETQATPALPVPPTTAPNVFEDYDFDSGITQIEDEAVPLAAGPVTRAEFIDYLWRHEGRPESDGVCTFTDVEKDHEYILALAWAEQNGIIEANEDGTFEPDELVTVAAVRDILDNFAEVFGLDVDVIALASLTGEDDEAVLNCDEVIAEFFRKETEEQKAA